MAAEGMPPMPYRDRDTATETRVLDAEVIAALTEFYQGHTGPGGTGGMECRPPLVARCPRCGGEGSVEVDANGFELEQAS
jgi:hypothetical protein